MAYRTECRTQVAESDARDVMDEFRSQSPAPCRVESRPDGKGTRTVTAYWDEPRRTFNVGPMLMGFPFR